MSQTEDVGLVQSTKRALEGVFFRFDGVVAVGVGMRSVGRSGEIVLRVYVRKKVSPGRAKAGELVPRRLQAVDVNGRPVPGTWVATDVEELRKLELAVGNRGRRRPVKPGFGINAPGKRGIRSVGTIGAVLVDLATILVIGGPPTPTRPTVKTLFDFLPELSLPRESVFFGKLPDLPPLPVEFAPEKKGGETIETSVKGPRWLLTAAHVVDLSADDDQRVVQPGARDGGKLAKDAIGSIARVTTTRNPVDAAVIELSEGTKADPAIQGIGNVTGSVEMSILDVHHRTTLRKSGRTTGVTRGALTDLSITTRPGIFAGGRIYRDHLLVADPAGNQKFAEAGDSGALVVDDKKRAVGLLVARDGNRGGAVVTPIHRVIAAVNSRFQTLGPLNRRTPQPLFQVYGR